MRDFKNKSSITGGHEQSMRAPVTPFPGHLSSLCHVA